MAQEEGFSHRFVTEAREHLAAMSRALIDLERSPKSPQVMVEQLLRAAHTIKGGAGFTGKRNIERLAHTTETAIENIRSGRVQCTAEVIDLLLAVVDRITVMVDDLDHSEEADISELLGRLQLLTDEPAAQVQMTRVAPATLPAPQPLADEFLVPKKLPAAVQSGELSLFGVKLDWFLCERQLGLSPLLVAQRLEQAGTVVESRTHLPGPGLTEGLPQAPMWLLAAVASPLSVKDFTEKLDIACAQVVQLKAKSESSSPKPPAAAENRAKAATAATSLRIAVPLIDQMMALAGELVLVRNQAIRSVNPSDVALTKLLRRLDSVTNDLQDAALRLRTQPVGTLFDRFPRMIRDLARQLGKQISVEITGSEVELDKTILEMLSDPLTHLIRNCCDHGIEKPDRRQESGKPAAGRISLSARQERGQIVIEISDDGRGIDPAALKRKAIEQGIRRSEELERLTDRQINELILLSGFSTAARVTDVSGRGVGMDVVKTNLDQIGGVIEIDSTIGRGSIFTMRLPLTLAIMPCLLLDSDGRCYAIPQRDVEEILLLDAADGRAKVEATHDGEVLRWREMLLPVVRLREVLARRQPHDAATLVEIAARYEASGAESSKGYAAVIRLGSRRFALTFDEVLESENLVVKPLHPLLRPLGIYAATTILGDGSVALIFNSEGLARHGGVLTRPMAGEVAALPAPGESIARQAVLLFRYNSRELLATSMESVKRILTLKPESIERIGDREFISLNGEVVNVLRLDRFLSISPPDESSQHFLILPRASGSPVGLLVSQIVDTQNIPPPGEDRAYKADGVIGTTVISGEIALVINFDRMVAMWERTHNHSTPLLPHEAGSKILVVDDTQFFQTVVAELLRSSKHQVSVAGNGVEALKMLKDGGFDLVVSDIEMPEMDGLMLARKVREDPQLSGIPMVALTTLSTPEIRSAAMASGFDAFEVKLDRESLVRSVGLLLSRQRGLAATTGGTRNA